MTTPPVGIVKQKMLNEDIMKKKNYYPILVAVCLLITLSIPSKASGERGSVDISRDNPKCKSGTEHYCSGSGNLCSYTIGFDCTVEHF